MIFQILFENTVIDYDAKRARIAMAPATDVVEDILEQTNMGDQIVSPDALFLSLT